MSSVPLTERLRAIGILQEAPRDDPRPDLAADTKRWKRVLTLAWAEADDLVEPLHALRCEGAALSHDYRLRRGECPSDLWAKLRARLKSPVVVERLGEVLRLAQATDPASRRTPDQEEVSMELVPPDRD